MRNKQNEKDTIILKSGEGRTYNCGTMTVIFKADEMKQPINIGISEWWLEPHSDGPGYTNMKRMMKSSMVLKVQHLYW